MDRIILTKVSSSICPFNSSSCNLNSNFNIFMMHCCSIVPLFTAPHVICPYLAVIFATITDTEKHSELTVEDVNMH